MLEVLHLLFLPLLPEILQPRRLFFVLPCRCAYQHRNCTQIVANATILVPAEIQHNHHTAWTHSSLMVALDSDNRAAWHRSTSSSLALNIYIRQTRPAPAHTAANGECDSAEEQPSSRDARCLLPAPSSHRTPSASTAKLGY